MGFVLFWVVFVVVAVVVVAVVVFVWGFFQLVSLGFLCAQCFVLFLVGLFCLFVAVVLFCLFVFLLVSDLPESAEEDSKRHDC